MATAFAAVSRCTAFPVATGNPMEPEAGIGSAWPAFVPRKIQADDSASNAERRTMLRHLTLVLSLAAAITPVTCYLVLVSWNDPGSLRQDQEPPVPHSVEEDRCPILPLAEDAAPLL